MGIFINIAERIIVWIRHQQWRESQKRIRGIRVGYNVCFGIVNEIKGNRFIQIGNNTAFSDYLYLTVWGTEDSWELTGHERLLPHPELSIGIIVVLVLITISLASTRLQSGITV